MQGAVQLQKAPVRLPQYKGEKGEASRWWREVTDMLSLLSPGTKPKDWGQFVPLIQSSLTSAPEVKDTFSRLRKKNTVDGKVDLATVMDAFIAVYDTHALDHLLRKWKSARQRPKEKIHSYQTRFLNLREDLAKQRYEINDFNAFTEFRNSVIKDAKVREEKELVESESIDHVVEYLANMEDSSVRERQPSTAVDTEVLFVPSNRDRQQATKRCGNCQRMYKHHANIRFKFNKACTFPRVSLRDQLAYENKRNNKRRSSQANAVPDDGEKDAAPSDGGADSAKQHKRQRKKAAQRLKKKLANTINMVSEVPASKNVDGPDGRHGASDGESGGGTRKVSMANMKIMGAEEWLTVTALFDSGAFPASFVSKDLVERLSLENFVKNSDREHGTAGQGGSFKSYGDLEILISLPNKAQLTATFTVADVSTEMIVGLGLLKEMGAIIDFVNDRVVCTKMRTKGKRTILPMLPMEEWSSTNHIDARKFMEEAAPVPAEFRKLFPGKNLRQIAQELEKVPPHLDLTVEQGRRIITNLLAKEYKEITIPRDRPAYYKDTSCASTF